MEPLRGGQNASLATSGQKAKNIIGVFWLALPSGLGPETIQAPSNRRLVSPS